MKGIDEFSRVVVISDIDNPKKDEEKSVGELCYEEAEDFIVKGWDESIDQESISTVDYVDIATIDADMYIYCFESGELGSTIDNEVFTKEGWRQLSDLRIGDEVRSSIGWSQLEDIKLSENMFSFGLISNELPILVNSIYIRLK